MINALNTFSTITSYGNRNLKNSVKNLVSIDWDINWQNVSNFNNGSNSFGSKMITLNLYNFNCSIINFYRAFANSYFTSISSLQWNISKGQNFYCMFYFCNNLITLNITDWNWNLSQSNSFENMFAYCTNLRELILNNWNVCNGVFFTNMFYNCANIKNWNVEQWNVSQGAYFGSMFAHCMNLTNLNVSNWNMANAKTLNSMFFYDFYLENLSCANWNINNVYSVTEMFAYCNRLSNSTLINIALMLTTANNIPSTKKNLSNRNQNSPFYYSNKWINSTVVGSDLVNQLKNIGWTGIS